MAQLQQNLHFLIKPASGRCNLACRYCFYKDVADHRDTHDYGIMSEETAALIIDRAFETGARSLHFGFQGGEPTLAGLPFFRNFVGLARARAEAVNADSGTGAVPVELSFSMQTNGILIDESWASFLGNEHFLLGVSIDGPRLLHDLWRTRGNGSGSFRDVMKGVEALRLAGVDMNALCVVDATTADNATTVYRFLRSRGFEWLQFIPCLDPLGEMPGTRPWSLSPAAYGRFLRETFDLRYAEWKNAARVNVRWIDNLVSMAMGIPPEICGMAGSCSVNFTIEADGSVYPCDFYVTDEWRLGNLATTSFDRMNSGDRARRFVEMSLPASPACASCFAFPLCRGGCRRDREPFSGDKPLLNRYCASFREFFRHAGSRILEMAESERILRQNPAHDEKVPG
jgi:uncharacterized protein